MKHKTALVIAHPGHELIIHNFIEKFKPDVFVLSDGSGRQGQSRVKTTRTILERAQAKLIETFGLVPDVELYEAMLEGKSDLFNSLFRILCQYFHENQYELIVVDAQEGYNPIHDLCQVMAESAQRSSSKTSGLTKKFDFTLIDDPSLIPNGFTDEECLVLDLDDHEFQRKEIAALEHSQLSLEVGQSIKKFGKDVFRRECLRPWQNANGHRCFEHNKPFYEIHSEEQVSLGHYKEVIRYSDHFLPICHGLELSLA